MRENVEKFAQQGLMSKMLATIHTSVEVPFEAEKLIITAPNKELLNELFNELEFRTMAKRVLGEDADQYSSNTRAHMHARARSKSVRAQMHAWTHAHTQITRQLSLALARTSKRTGVRSVLEPLLPTW